MKLADIIDRQNAIRSELTALEENPDTTEEDHADLRDSLIEEYETLSKRAAPVIERMEKLKLIQRTSDQPGSREGGDGTVSRWDGGGRGPEFMQRQDPFADLDRVRDRMVKPSETVSRAVTATENAHRKGLLDSGRAEEATRKIQRNPFVARHCLLTGSDDYVEAFRAYLEDPMGEAQRAGPVSLTLANGGYLLPYVLDPTIVLTNNSSSNPYRRIAKVIQTTSNAWQGVNSAGVNAQWLSESVTAADASPAVGQIQIFPKKAAAWVFGTFEAIEDTSFSDQLPGMLGDAKDRLEESAFATGTGVTGSQTGSPRGVLVAISATGTGSRVLSTMGTATGGLIGTAAAADVYNLQAALPPRFRMDNSVGLGCEHHEHQPDPRTRPVRRLVVLGESGAGHPGAAAG